MGIDLKHGNRFKLVAIVIALCIATVPIIYFITSHRIIYAILIIIGLLGIATFLVTLLNPRIGLVIIMLYCSSMFIIARVIGKEDIPYGVIRDILIGITFLGIVVQRLIKKHEQKWINSSPIFIAMVILTLYSLIQFFNPYGSILGWLAAMRGFASYLMLYLIFMHLFKDYKSVVDFTKLWMFILFLSALYACYQEWVGLPDFDYRWVTANPKRIGLNFSGGNWDKWSFLSDVAAFGVTIAFAVIFTLILCVGHFSKRKKLTLYVLSIFMILGMVYSGNRTAYAMIPFGFLLFGLLTFNNIRTLGLTAFVSITIVVIIFGPFYGQHINRLRTAFFPFDDPSMQLRDRNREFIRPYILNYPIGNGIFSTGDHAAQYNPNHELSGFPTDSLYLEITLEQGWIGLIIRLTLYFLIVWKGVDSYIKAKDKKIKILYLAYTCSFFALTIAAYAKKAVAQVPLGIILMGIYVIMDKLIEYDKQKNKLDINKN